jgi:hypothetical protein
MTSASNTWSYNHCFSDYMVKYRNRAWSAKAWHKHKYRFCNQKQLGDFAAGFRAGYEAVADGSDGCTPPFAPRSYWGWQFQSAEGQARTAAWFSGYPLGAQIAEEEGIGYWSQLQSSSTIQTEYAQAGMLTGSPIYPIPESATNIQGAMPGTAPGQPAMAPTPVPDPAAARGAAPTAATPTATPTAANSPAESDAAAYGYGDGGAAAWMPVSQLPSDTSYEGTAVLEDDGT